jgi:hypothetical protein
MRRTEPIIYVYRMLNTSNVDEFLITACEYIINITFYGKAIPFSHTNTIDTQSSVYQKQVSENFFLLKFVSRSVATEEYRKLTF